MKVTQIREGLEIRKEHQEGSEEKPTEDAQGKQEHVRV